MRGTDVSALAAEAAYFSILAIAPFLLFLIAGIAVISQLVPIALVDDLESTVTRMAPGDTGELLLPLVEEAVYRSDSGMLSFGMVSAMIVAMWSGSRAIASLMKGSSRISGREVERPLIWKRLVALGLAAVMGAALMLSVAVFLFGRGMGRAIAEGVQMGDTFAVLWTYISWPMMGGIVLLMMSVFYWFASARYTDRLAFVSPGAVVATVLWVLVMAGLRLFLWVIDPGSVYGALGSFVLLVVFFYIMSLVLLLGAAVNAEVRDGPEPDNPVAPT
jgi:membrane protein